MVSGVTIRGKSIPIKQVNPFFLDSERVTRIRIQNIPLSADDNIIKHVLILRGLEIRSFIHEKLRINGKLTNCSTGDRLVTVKSSSLKEPLHRFMEFGVFKAKVIHRGQVNPALKCKKCLSIGHVIADCKNEWKCIECGADGHKKGECDVGTEKESESSSESDAASESDEASRHAEASNLRAEQDDTNVISPPDPDHSTSTLNTQHGKSTTPLPQTNEQSKRRRKKAKSKSNNETLPATSRTEISKYFRQNPTSETPGRIKSRTNSVTRSPRSPLDDPNSTKKTCTS
jgi:hypothetical protein